MGCGQLKCEVVHSRSRLRLHGRTRRPTMTRRGRLAGKIGEVAHEISKRIVEVLVAQRFPAHAGRNR
jgi:hypothetical protein